MAILEEQVNEIQVRHYSNLNFKIKQVETGIVYEDAVDVIPCRYTYEETNEPISSEQDFGPEDALKIILGESK